MRYSIYPKNSDKPLIRKKLGYVEDLISHGWADWLDTTQKHLGCRLRGHFLDRHEESLSKAAGSGFDTAWSIRMSGYAGPLVWQLKTPKALASA